MTKKELYDMTFNEAAEKLCETNDCITTYETLKSFAVMNVENDSFNVAIHILEALRSYPYTQDLVAIDKRNSLSKDKFVYVMTTPKETIF